MMKVIRRLGEDVTCGQLDEYVLPTDAPFLRGDQGGGGIFQRKLFRFTKGDLLEGVNVEELLRLYCVVGEELCVDYGGRGLVIRDINSVCRWIVIDLIHRTHTEEGNFVFELRLKQMGFVEREEIFAGGFGARVALVAGFTGEVG